MNQDTAYVTRYEVAVWSMSYGVDSLDMPGTFNIQVSYGEMVGCDNDDVCAARVRSCLPFSEYIFP